MKSLRWVQRRRVKHLPKLCLQLFVISFCVLSLVDSKLTAQKKKKPVINWNNSYYKEPYHRCKKLRPLNPVETMRAQTVAANMFRRCATKIIVKYATKYRFPAYAISYVTDGLCSIYNLSWALAAGDGSLIAPASFRSQTLIDFLRKQGLAADKGNLEIVARHRKETFIITGKMVLEFNDEILPCTFPTEFLVPLDGDYMKHAVEHWLKMLL